MKCPVCGEHGCPCYRAGLEDGLEESDADDLDEDELEEEDELERERRTRG